MAAKNLMDLTGRVAVVIGGTSGLGREMAIGLATAGADIVPTGRREAMVEEVCAEVERAGGRTLRRVCDIGSRASVDQFRDAVLTEFGQVDILVNAAGQIFRKPTVDVSEVEWDRLMDVNLTGMLRTCQSFYPALAANRRGRIVNIASLNSYVALVQVTRMVVEVHPLCAFQSHPPVAGTDSVASKPGECLVKIGQHRRPQVENVDVETKLAAFGDRPAIQLAGPQDERPRPVPQSAGSAPQLAPRLEKAGIRRG